MKHLLLTTLFLVVGCAVTPSVVPDTLPVTGSSVDKAKAHVESATGLVVRATPESNTTGKALLAAATDEQAKAVKELEAAKTELAAVAAERKQIEAEKAKVEGERDDIQAQLDKVKSGWGYQLQQFVLKLFWLIVSLTALHFILGIAGLFISGPIGNVVAKVGVFLNPFAWFQSIRDNHWFNKNPPCPPAV